ncbi:hypothetical protein EC973_006441 [Apophysomyces ossiformis]|uniref:Cytochrome P450 n=1 Tax=Apophysomyces ossiformis TaxID=679940 RepID=A0A8H7BW13_9FUNG|nr:hypothetical protein EC973_006441 [Apophysomyces ossiformis]
MGHITTVAAGRSAEEVFKAESSVLSLEKGVLIDVLHLHYVVDPLTFEIGMTVNPVVAKLAIPSPKIPQYTDRIIVGLNRGLERLLGDEESITLKHPSLFFQKWVAYMSVPSLIGEEVATNTDVISSFANFTGDVTNNIPAFMIIPKIFHRFLLPFMQSKNHHRQVMRDHVVPVIRRRRAKMAEAAAQGKPHGLELNFLQGLIEYVKPDGSQYSDEDIANAILLVAFASVHTTSMNMSFALYWLLARPDLLVELKKEMNDVLGDGPVTSEGLEKMKFLDCFLRESLRRGVDKLAGSKKVLQDFTFSNGYQVPKGRTVQTASLQLNLGLDISKEALDQMDPSLSKDRRTTTPARDFVTFGMGKHLCPGRFFAVHEIKLSLITLLRRYDISTLSGQSPKPVHYFGGAMAMNCEDPLLLEKRK